MLRAYYNEKGRALPSWLPPDPRAPTTPVSIQPVYTSNVGAGYGGGVSPLPQGRGALSSLWDTGNQGPPGQPQSLRAGRAVRPQVASAGQNPFRDQQKSRTTQPEIQARPLPSQRAGSQQSASSYGTPTGSSSGQPPSDKKQRLANQFGGGRSASYATPTAPPSQSNNSYSSVRSGRSNYEDRFAPPANGYGRQSSEGGSEKPFVAATAPWMSDADQFVGGGYGGGAQAGSQGLPGGPAAGKRGPGLPGGPRGYR